MVDPNRFGEPLTRETLHVTQGEVLMNVFMNPRMKSVSALTLPNLPVSVYLALELYVIHVSHGRDSSGILW